MIVRLCQINYTKIFNKAIIYRPVCTSQRKQQTWVNPLPKQCFIAMVCNSKLHGVILWCVIRVKLNLGKYITGLEIMTFNRKKI